MESPGRWRIWLLELLAPLVRRLPRGERFIYWSICGEWGLPTTHWPFRRIRVQRAWRHGYLVVLDMSHELQRRAFYTGRYYERDVPALLWQIVRADDIVIDIGANVGHISLLCARRVGSAGRVISYEPNPAVRAQLSASRLLNEIWHMEVREDALSDEDGAGNLAVNHQEPGQSTLRQMHSTAATPVTIRKSQVIAADLQGDRPTLIKIDVEGYEMHVVRGLGPVLDNRNLSLLVEVTDEWLRQLGTSWDELRSLMSERGYVPFEIIEKRTPSQPNGVQLKRMSNQSARPEQFNALFCRPNGIWHTRVQALIEE